MVMVMMIEAARGGDNTGSRGALKKPWRPP